MMTNKTEQDSLNRFGFTFQRGGAHISRTMMLEEMQALLSYVDPNSPQNTYLHAIEEENCLGKRSARTRKLTCRHLLDLYSLDPSILLYRALLFFWQRNLDGQPLLALLCSYARDPILRMSAPFVLKLSEGAIVNRENLEEFIDAREPGRFSRATLKSTAQNVNSTWTKSGHIIGKVKKSRSKALATPASVAYALLLGYLTGARGHALFRTEYARLLDCSADEAIEHAEHASRKGWITVKRVGNVIEVLFPNLINDEEMGWLRE